MDDRELWGWHMIPRKAIPYWDGTLHTNTLPINRSWLGSCVLGLGITLEN